jgi:5-methylthioadenosine/S-adenosylhomocysteine deaminase
MEKAQITPAFIRRESAKAIAEMKAHGTAAFCDMYFFPEETARVAKKLKVTAVLGQTLLDFPIPDASDFATGLARAESFIKKFKNDPYITPCVSPHSIYTVGRENLIKSGRLAQKYGVLWQIHLAETEQEVKDCKKQHGVTPAEYLDQLGLLNERTLLAHCVWVSDSDIKLIAKRKASVAHCPLSNLKLGSGIAPVAKMIQSGVNVSLGTDGAASSNRLDIWEAGKFAALLQKGINRDPTLLPANQIFKIMTTNGMRASGIKKLAGKTIHQWDQEIDRALAKDPTLAAKLYE